MTNAEPSASDAARDNAERKKDAVHIRVFQPDDAPEVIALWTAVFGYSAPHNDPATVIRLKQEAADGLFFVAVAANDAAEGNNAKGCVAGTVMGGYDGHRGWIYSLAVRPDAQGQGIGTTLMRHVEAALRERGCLKINLQALVSNQEVVAFYARLGYRVEERVSMGKLL